jgi:hypothetical protein
MENESTATRTTKNALEIRKPFPVVSAAPAVPDRFP